MNRRGIVIVMSVVAALLAACEQPDTSLVPPPQVGWPTNGGNWYNQRYSPLTEIDRSNVANLKGVWRTHLEGSGVGPQYSAKRSRSSSTASSMCRRARATCSRSTSQPGTILWSYKSGSTRRSTSSAAAGRAAASRTATGEFSWQLDGQLVALDAKTGAVAWTVQAERWQDGFSLTSAPLYYDGLVITGFAGAEFGVRGRVKAFAADSGEVVWTFYTIPGRGEPGNETWPQNNDLWQHGGATVWHTPAVDPELGLIYLLDGQSGTRLQRRRARRATTSTRRRSSPRSSRPDGTAGTSSKSITTSGTTTARARSCSSTSSMTAACARVWRRRARPAGFTFSTAPMARRSSASTRSPCRRSRAKRRLRRNPIRVGDAFSPQHLDIAPEGYPLVNGGRIFTPYWTDYIIAKPGIFGGANWPPTAYDPVMGHLYVCATDAASSFSRPSRYRAPAGR